MLLYPRYTHSYVVLYIFSHLGTKFIQRSHPIEWSSIDLAAWVNSAVSHIVFSYDPTRFGSRWVQRCAFKEPSHEGKAVPPDVGLPSEGVEDRIGTAADEGQSRGHCTTGCINMFQPADEQSIKYLSYNYIMCLYCMFKDTILFNSLDYEKV